MRKTDKSRLRKNSPKNRKLILAIIIFLVIGVVLPTQGIYRSTKQLIIHGQKISAASKLENLDQIKSETLATKQTIEGLDNYLNFLIWLRLIPFVGGYYSDAKHFSSAARYEMEVVESAVKILEPFKTELGLTGQATSGQDRVAQMVKIMDKLLPSIDKFEPSLHKARKEVELIDIGRYPESIGNKSVRQKVEGVKELIIGAHVAVTENRALIEALPDALGQNKPKSYFLLFQNDKELRATGGFITAYAFLELNNGHLSTTSSDDIYRLDERLLKVCLMKICPLTPPAPIVKYLPETTGKPRSAWSMRDSNLSPDLPTSVKEFERMYTMLGEGLPFDGIITIDTQVVEELVAVTGPIEAGGITYSAQIDKRCNCPNVIYELEHYAEVAAKGEADRKAIVGELMQQLLARILGSGPNKLPDFANVFFKLTNDKHIMFYMHDPKLQAELSKLNWTGEVRSESGDYFAINDSNFAGGKSNLYVEEKVTLDISIDSAGQVKNRVTIEYKNPQPFNIWLNGILRDYVRIYTPLGSQKIAARGSDDPVVGVDDQTLNKTYFEGFLTVRPQNSRNFILEYTSPVNVTDKTYKLLIQKQPGAKDHHYIVKINGKTKAEFNLTSDKQLNLSF